MVREKQPESERSHQDWQSAQGMFGQRFWFSSNMMSGTVAKQLSFLLLCLEHIVPVHSALKMKLVGQHDVNELPGVWNVDQLEDYFLDSGTTDYKLLGCKTHPGLQFQGHQILLLRVSERVSGYWWDVAVVQICASVQQKCLNCNFCWLNIE